MVSVFGHGRLLASVAALLGLASLAAADGENLVFIEQDGVDNAGVIDQVGLGNAAGTELLPMQQLGSYNSLTIEQSGLNNRIGTQGNSVLQSNVFINPAAANSARLIQNGESNRMSEIQQYSLGTVPLAANRLDMEQKFGDGNVVGFVSQIQQSDTPGQSALVRQYGSLNRIDTIEQVSASDMRNEENTIDIRIDGANNGTTALAGFAAVPGAVASHVRQRTGTEDLGANGNFLRADIFANDTAFGFDQRGRLNSTGLIAITGDGNALGIAQDGTENDITLSLVEGTDNEIGIGQYGTNAATANLLGATSDDNRVLIRQQGTNGAEVNVEGSRNTTTTDQDYLAGLGGRNQAETRIEGNDNFTNLQQYGSNEFLVVITGNSNNAAGGFSALVPAGAQPGYFLQEGFDNKIDAHLVGNANLTTAQQIGGGNLFTLLVQGDDNEAYLRQTGSGNTADLTQNGTANVAVFRQ